MKIFIIGTQGLPARYGGFETLVDRLTIGKQSKDIHYVVTCQRTDSVNRLKSCNGADLMYLPFSANGIQSVLYDVWALLIAAARADAVLVLGTSGAILIPAIRLFRPKLRIVTNMAGIEWGRSKWNRLASMFLRISEAAAIRYSTTVVADNKKLVQYVRDEYSRQAEFIPYGGDHRTRPQEPDSGRETRPELPDDYFVMVARCQPDNNFEIILDAFSDFEANIVVVSNCDGDSYGDWLIQKYGGLANIYFVGTIYDMNLLNRIREDARAYIHGHSAGGTNPALVEALWLECQVLAYRNGFNEATAGRAASYFSSTEELQSLLDKMKGPKRANLDARRRARQMYRWEEVVAGYERVLIGD